MSSFYSAKWGNIFYYIWTIQLLIKYTKFFQQWYILYYAMAVTMVSYTEAWNIELKTSKPLWKMWKYKMKLSTWQKTNLKTERKTITDNLILLKWYTAFNELIIKNTLVKIKTTFVLMERFHLPQRQISLPKVFWKEGVLSNFEKFTGKHLCQSFFLNKVAGFSLWKERFWHKRFHVNFVKFLRTSFLHRTPLRDSFCHYETAKPFTTKYLSH